MNEQRPDDTWADIDALEVPSYAGRRLDAGGFVFGDSFDLVLRHLSADYLSAAWGRLYSCLRRYGVGLDDLSWGWLHGGETRIVGLEQPAPSDFTGWTTLRLDRFRFDEDPRFVQMDDELKVGSPALRCGCTWRSKKWNIAPDDFPLALHLIEALWTDEPTGWGPNTVLGDQERIMNLWGKVSAAKVEGNVAEHDKYWAQAQAAYTSPEYRLHDEARLSEPWRKVAAAIEVGSQQHIELALAEAQAAYSPLGYSILIRGFKKYLSNPVDDVSIHFP